MISEQPIPATDDQLKLKKSPRVQLGRLLKPRFREENFKNALQKTERSLTTWQKLTEDRKNAQEKLAKELHRKVDELVLHDGDKMRAKVESRIIIDHAQIQKKASLRNGIWEQAARLAMPCPSYGKPEYIATRSRIERGVVPSFTYIGMPKPVLEEEQGVQGIIDRCHGFQKSEYKKQREEELQNKIARLQPHRPDISELIIIGRGPKMPEVIIDVPPIEIEKSFSQYCPVHIVSDVYALQINNTIFYKMRECPAEKYFREMQYEKWHENLTDWVYNYNTIVNVRQSKTLFLRNLGTVALRYCWHAITNFLPYLPNVNLPPAFFFNKNESILSPGQVREIKIDVVSNLPGIYKEKWQLKISNVDFFHKIDKKLLIYLNADVVEDDLDYLEKEKQTIMDSKYEASRNFFLKDIIHYCLENVFKQVPEFYPYKKLLEERDIFLMLNPMCFYHQTNLIPLKNLYEQTKGETWDLSIKTLRDWIKTFDLIERTDSSDMLRSCYKTFLKPRVEDPALNERKLRATREILGRFLDSFYDTKCLVLDFCFIQDQVPNQLVFVSMMRQKMNEMIEEIASTLQSLDIYRFIDFTQK